MKRLTLLATLAFAACSPQQSAAPAPDLKALEAAHDWQNGPGEALGKSWNDGVKAYLGKMTRPDAIKAITDAGFECIYGEAHEQYPDPMAVCTRSFATRACQMDWEIASTADKGKVDEVDGTYTRDCVGVDRDWPEPKVSPIDDQLAPPSLPGPAAPTPAAPSN